MRQRKLSDVFFSHKGHVSDKWEHYLGIYEYELASLIDNDRAIALLEIGVQNGGSLEVWKKYLPEGSRVTGIDIDERCGKIPFQSDVEVIVCDVSNQENLNAALNGRIFDVIIDDGSHVSPQIISAFKSLFARLRPGGKFIIEDLHACYFSSHGGGYRHPGSAIEWLKNVVDWLNVDHFDASLCADELVGIASLPNEIARVTFYDSVAVVEKLPVTKRFPYRRILTGREASVVNPATWLANFPALGSLMASDDCARTLETRLVNELAVMRTTAREAASAAAQQMAARDTDIEGLARRLKQSESDLAALRADGTAHEQRYKAEIGRLEGSVAERFRELAALNQLLHDQAARTEIQQTAFAAAEARVAKAEAQAERQASEIARLEANVAERFRETESLTRLLREKTEESEKRETRAKKAEAESERLSSEIARLEANVAERFREIETITRLLKDKTEESETHEKASSAAVARARNAEAQAEQHRGEIARLEATVADRLRDIASLTRQLKDKTEESEKRERAASAVLARAKEAEATVERQAAEIGKLQANIAERFGELAILSRLLKEKETAADPADAGARPQGERLSSLQESRVWKIAARLPNAFKVRRRLRRERQLVAASGLFDASWYLERNPDVKAAGVDPLDHFLLFGGREGRAASRAFDSSAYLRAYADVGSAGLNPLVHYLRHGREEGRKAFALR